MSRVRRGLEILALGVTLVAGYLYFDELDRLWIFWVLAGVTLAAVAVTVPKRRVRRVVRAVKRRLPGGGS